MTAGPSPAAAGPLPGDHGHVRVPVADLRAAPDAGAERVNQGLLATPVAVLATEAGATAWLQVRLPDYDGWMQAADIAATAAPPVAERQVRVAAASTDLRLIDADGVPGDRTLTAYAGTTLPLAPDAAAGGMEGLVIVDLPENQQALVAPAALAPVAPDYQGSAAAVLATAGLFEGTPYLWGGMTRAGIDCSGLTQIAYRVHGYPLPRDADQQFLGPAQPVERDALEPGDLLFFGPRAGEVAHVMLYLGDARVIHASAAAGRVIVQTLDAGAADYHRRTDQYLGARRVIAGPPLAGDTRGL